MRLGLDVPLLLVIFTLVVFGALMVYSASWDFSLAIFESPTFIFVRQMNWLALGIGVAVILTLIDYHLLGRVAVPAMAITVLGLMAVLLVNEVRFGATRTLLQGSYQPSELAKLVIVVYLAVWLFSKREFIDNVGFGLLPLASILGVVGGLIFLQPDLSAVITVVVLGVMMFFLAGGALKQIAILLVVTVIVGWFVVRVSPTGRGRVDAYIDGLRDPTQASYHIRRSLEAFVKGGWAGVGIGKADTKLTGLPVPPTDSIFAVVGEETGVIGASGLVVLYSLLLWRGLVIARRAPDLLGVLLASGLTLLIAMEASINMGAMVGLLPFAGNALPFISAGGSNLVVSLAAIGIVMNVSRISQKQEQEAANTFSPVINLRNRRKKYMASYSGKDS